MTVFVNFVCCSSSHSGLGDSSLLSNIQKLFFEKIEVFGNVEFTKLSIVTGVIKIALKVSQFHLLLSRYIIHVNILCTGYFY